MSKERKLNSLSRRREAVQVADLHDLLSKKEEELNRIRGTLDGIREERDQLRRKVHNLRSELNHAVDLKSSSTDRQSLPDLSPGSGTGTLQISKKADRVKVIKTAEFKKAGKDEKPKYSIHGTDLDPNKISSATAEHVVQGMAAASRAQEILSDLDSNDRDSFEMKLRENLELELERMNCQSEKMKSENNLLRLTLQESKNRAEQSQMLLSKYESNNTAHVMTLFYSELITEGLSAIWSIMEKDIMKSAYLRDVLSNAKESNRHRLERAISGLKTVMHENVALSGVPCSIDEFLEQFEERECLQQELTVADLASAIELCRTAEERRKAIKRSIVDLETFSVEALPTKFVKRVSEFDLENAVLLHELASVKEELINLKCEYRKANNSNNSGSATFETCSDGKRTKASSQSSSTSSFDVAFSGSVQSFNAEATETELNKKPAFLSLADLRIGTMTESELGTELSEALKREGRLKKDNDRLAFALQRVQQNGERRHLKSMEVMSNLNTAYSALLENSKENKFRHISRIQELERMLYLSEEQYQKQIGRLKQQVLVYERERENWVLPDNETAL